MKKKEVVGSWTSLLKEAKLKLEQMQKGSVFVTDRRAMIIIEKMILEIENLVEENTKLRREKLVLELKRLRDTKQKR